MLLWLSDQQLYASLVGWIVPFICSFTAFGLLWRFFRIKTRLPGVPVIPSNSFLGFTKINFPIDGSSHKIVLSLVDHYGAIVQYRIFGQTVLLVNDPSLAHVALKNIKGKGFFQRGDPTLNPPNMFNLDTNADWFRRRKLFKKSFSMQMLKSQGKIVQALSQKVATKFEAAADSGTPVDVDFIFGQFTIDIICAIAFEFPMNSLEDAACYKDLSISIAAAFKYAWIPLIPWISHLIALPLPVFSKYKAAKATRNAFGATILAHLRHLKAAGTLDEEGLGKAILDFADMPGISEEDVISEIMLLLIAGHETTAHTLAILLYVLAKYPQAQRKVQSDIDEWKKKKEAEVAGAGVSPSFPPYLEASIKESMRRYPVASMGSFRLVTADDGFLLQAEAGAGMGAEVGAEVGATRLPPSCEWAQAQGQHQHHDQREEDEHGAHAREHLRERLREGVDRRLHHTGDDDSADSAEGGEASSTGPVSVSSCPFKRATPTNTGTHVTPATPRKATTPVEAPPRPPEGPDLTSVLVPKGTWIMVNMYALQNSASNWGPDALDFKPERWLAPPREAQRATDNSDDVSHADTLGDDVSHADTLGDDVSHADTLGDDVSHAERERDTRDEEGAKRGGEEGGSEGKARSRLSSPASFAGCGRVPGELFFAPFSFGPRNCLGMNLAMLEIHTASLELLSRFSFALADEAMREDSVALETHFILRPCADKGMPLLVLSRSVVPHVEL